MDDIERTTQEANEVQWSDTDWDTDTDSDTNTGNGDSDGRAYTRTHSDTATTSDDSNAEMDNIEHDSKTNEESRKGRELLRYRKEMKRRDSRVISYRNLESVTDIVVDHNGRTTSMTRLRLHMQTRNAKSKLKRTSKKQQRAPITAAEAAKAKLYNSGILKLTDKVRVHLRGDDKTNTSESIHRQTHDSWTKRGGLNKVGNGGIDCQCRYCNTTEDLKTILSLGALDLKKEYEKTLQRHRIIV